MEPGCRVWVFLIHGMCNYVSHCRRSTAQSLCQVRYSHTFWIWRQLNLSCVPYDDQINGLTEAFSINTANWPYLKVLKTVSFLFKILTNMSQDRPGQLHYPPNTYCLFCKEGCLITRRLFSQRNYSSWSHVPVFGKTLVLREIKTRKRKYIAEIKNLIYF